MKRPILTLMLAALLALSAVAAAAADTARIGNDVEYRNQVDDSWQDWWIVDTNRPAETAGTIDQIDYWAENTDNEVRFLLVDGQQTVQWKSELVTPDGTGEQSHTFAPTFIGEGWHLGVYYPSYGVVAFSGDGDTYLEGNQGVGEPDVGDTLSDADSRDRTYSLGADITPLAAPIVTVDETNLGDDWDTDDTREGGSVAFIDDDTSPHGGALQLTTGDDNDDKANIATDLDPVALEEVTALGYHTYQVDGADLAAASYQLYVTFDDDSSTWLVYEPYWQNDAPDAEPVVAGEWQEWDLLDGAQFWSSHEAADGQLQPGGGGDPFYTLDGVADLDAGATVERIALNVGSHNPDWTVLADGMTFGDRDGITTYDFQPAATPEDKAACKDGGWEELTDDDGREFRNQGDCVSFLASDGKTRGGGNR